MDRIENKIVVGFSINPEIWFESVKTNDPEKKEVSSHGLSIAGSSANIGQALSKLGCHAEIIGAIGEDDYASNLLKYELMKHNINFTPLKILDSTNIAFIPLEKSGKNNVVHGKKGNLDSSKLFLCKETIRNTRSTWRIASSIRYEEMPLAMDLLDKEYLGFRSLNIKSNAIASARTFSRDLVQNTDLLILNKYEFECFKLKEEEFFLLGPKVLIITDGENGGKCYTENFSFDYLPTDFSGTKYTTGAGDWFHAGLISSLIQQDKNIIEASENEKILKDATNFASKVAGRKVLFHGSGNGPTLDML